MKEAGEKFKLPGGEVQIGEEKENLDPLEGVLREWGPLTKALADTLSEIQSGKTEVYSPRRLLSLLHSKCPQFAGYDQHDSHELLRQLLELVRTEDLQVWKCFFLAKVICYFWKGNILKVWSNRVGALTNQGHASLQSRF